MNQGKELILHQERSGLTINQSESRCELELTL